MTHIVIIGGGVAAGTAAKTLRKEGYDGDVTIVSRGGAPALPAPAAVEGLPRGQGGHGCRDPPAAEWYAEQGIDLRTSTRAVSLDPTAHEVVLDDDSVLGYDSVLLATGASPRSLPLEGAELPGVRTLRRLDDSDDLAAQLRAGGRRLVIIGSGWIGMEVGATARDAGQ